MGKKIKCPHCKQEIDLEDLEKVEDTRGATGTDAKSLNTGRVL